MVSSEACLLFNGGYPSSGSVRQTLLLAPAFGEAIEAPHRHFAIPALVLAPFPVTTETTSDFMADRPKDQLSPVNLPQDAWCASGPSFEVHLATRAKYRQT